MEQLHVGDRLLTPYGIARVEGFDLVRGGIVTTHGSWGMEEVEPLPAPDMSDPDQVEAWLGVTARVVPRTKIESVSVVCHCKCGHCYRVDQYQEIRHQVSVMPIKSFHFRQNEICRCPEELCSCL